MRAILLFSLSLLPVLASPPAPDLNLKLTAPISTWDEGLPLGNGTMGLLMWGDGDTLRLSLDRGDLWVRMLDVYASAFILRNGFHANGDQTKSGFSDFTYRPFTLEGNFLAMHAVHEMMLQSWSPTPGKRDSEIIRLFPGMPWRWHGASFTGLRSEGGHVVSAKRENNATTSFRIVAGRNGLLRLADNFGGRAITWKKGNMEMTGGIYQASVRKDDIIEGTLPEPGAVPAAPENAAKQVIVPSRN